MTKYNEKQRERLQEISVREGHIDEIIHEKIDDPYAPLPLNLILESRFLAVQKRGIRLEAEISHLEEDKEANEYDLEYKNRRLDQIRGRLKEIQNVGEMLQNFDSTGREFEIVPS